MLNALHLSPRSGRTRRWPGGLFTLASVCALASCGGTAPPGAEPSAITQAAPGAGQRAIVPATADPPSRAVCDDPTPAGFARCHSRVQTDASGGVQAFATPAGLAPSDLQGAYDVPAAMFSGATIAIVDAFDDPNAESDLAAYRKQFGLSACTTANGCFRKLNQRGQSSPLPPANGGWAVEISLDLDMASAICPSCKILLVESDNNSMANLGAAVNAAAAAGATVISNSYGGGEGSSNGSNDDSYFNHPGIAIFASTGDDGYGVAYPATSRNVTAVGGTRLTKAPGTVRGWTETAWSGAGSGCSQYTAKPGWQRDLGCANRAISDVSAVADPASGVAVYDSYGQGGWMVVGGTSAASPIVASIYALTGRGSADPSFSYLNSTLFFDPDTGSNGSCGGSYLCTSGPGYDGPTGNGSPDAAMLAFGPPPGVTFFENFYGDADIRQCNYAAYGTISAPIEHWTPAVRIDTGSLAGGCIQEFAIQDPANELAGVTLNVDFEPDGDGQCDQPGPRNIPISPRATGWTSPYRIDTDNRAGGCLQKFTLSGPDVIAFDVDFVPDTDPNTVASQCGNAGVHTITTGQSVTVRLNTDDNPGGCLERFRIRKR